MTETKKRKKRLFHRRFSKAISKYPACEHLNTALWYLLKKPEENRDVIGEIVYAIVKSGGYINDVRKKTLKEMGFML